MDLKSNADLLQVYLRLILSLKMMITLVSMLPPFTKLRYCIKETITLLKYIITV